MVRPNQTVSCRHLAYVVLDSCKVGEISCGPSIVKGRTDMQHVINALAHQCSVRTTVV
jgi:hypothetical protein